MSADVLEFRISEFGLWLCFIGPASFCAGLPSSATICVFLCFCFVILCLSLLFNSASCNESVSTTKGKNKVPPAAIRTLFFRHRF